jgi:transcription initiation factor IIE alpha subunit
MKMTYHFEPLARATDPITSYQAAESVKESAKQHQSVIFMCLLKHGALGKDGISKLTGLDSNQVARRLAELQRQGQIALTGRTVKSKSGRNEREWHVSPIQKVLL